MSHKSLISFMIAASTLFASAATAQELRVDGDATRVGWDVEVDPLAYALEGHSLHVGAWWRDWRIDVGSFGLKAPAWSHGQEGFTQSFSGFGLKLDRAFGDARDAWFVGAEAGLARTTVRLDQTGESDTTPILNVGVRAGYRWRVTERLFVAPWVGVGYAVGARDVTLGQRRFMSQRVTVFPTIHVGYQIQ